MLCLSGFELYSRWVPLRKVLILVPHKSFVAFSYKLGLVNTLGEKLASTLLHESGNTS